MNKEFYRLVEKDYSDNPNSAKNFLIDDMWVYEVIPRLTLEDEKALAKTLDPTILHLLRKSKNTLNLHSSESIATYAKWFPNAREISTSSDRLSDVHKYYPDVEQLKVLISMDKLYEVCNISSFNELTKYNTDVKRLKVLISMSNLYEVCDFSSFKSLKCLQIMLDRNSEFLLAYYPVKFHDNPSSSCIVEVFGIVDDFRKYVNNIISGIRCLSSLEELKITICADAIETFCCVAEDIANEVDESKAMSKLRTLHADFSIDSFCDPLRDGFIFNHLQCLRLRFYTFDVDSILLDRLFMSSVQLKELELVLCSGLNSHNISKIANAVTLESLSFHQCKDMEFDATTSFYRIVGLRKFELENCVNYFDLSALSENTMLQRISLNQNDRVISIPNVSKLDRLLDLRIGCESPFVGNDFILDYSQISGLKTLEINSGPDTVHRILEIIDCFVNLKSFSLFCEKPNAVILNNVRPFGLSNLRELTFYNIHGDKSFIDAIISCSDLRRLTICNISPDLFPFVNFKKFNVLSKLRVLGMNIGFSHYHEVISGFFENIKINYYELWIGIPYSSTLRVVKSM